MLDFSEKFVKTYILEKDQKINTIWDAVGTKALLVREARKRDWEVHNLSKGITYFTSEKTFKGAMVGHTPQTNSFVGRLIAMRKDYTKQALELNGIPTPGGKAFSYDQYEEALEFFQAQSSPLVIKPSRGSTGRGITMSVSTPEQFQDAWEYAVKEDGNNPVVLLEELINGFDIRVVVVDGKARAAATRVAPFIVGDGKSTFETLLNNHQQARHSNGYLRTHKLEIEDNWIAQNGWTNSTVLPDGEIAFLRTTSNASRGGFIVDVLPLVSPPLIELAEAAASACGGLGVVGVDLMVTSFSSADGAIVLELNPSPHVEIHHFPTFGQITDVAFHVMNHLERDAMR